jgi:hypothetical protein
MCPSADQVGLANPLTAASHSKPVPSARITDTTLELQKKKPQGQVTKAMRWPSGDQAD